MCSKSNKIISGCSDLLNFVVYNTRHKFPGEETQMLAKTGSLELGNSIVINVIAMFTIPCDGCAHICL